MPPREIITLQLGHYANHVGTHYWNTQESYLEWPANVLQDADMQMDALYQVGQDTAGQETYTPRVLIIDLKGALHTLKVENELFGGSSSLSQINAPPVTSSGAVGPTSAAMPSWDGHVEEHLSAPHVQNDYIRDLNANTVVPSTDEADDPYDLDEQVHIWSDYNRALYHPRSVYQVDEYAHADDTLPFYDFEQGKQLASTDAFRDEVIEGRLRSLLENCDYPQGLQIFTDVDNGFGGLAATLIEEFKEDKFLFRQGPSIKDRRQVKKLRRYRTIGKATAHFLEFASTYVPLSTSALRQQDKLGWSRHLHFDPQMMYHTSALHAMAIETVMRPCTLKTEPMTLFNLSSLLRPYSTSLATLYASQPLPLQRDTSLRHLIAESEPSKRYSAGWNMMSLMHHGRLLGHKRLTQMIVTRGLTTKHVDDILGPQHAVPVRDPSIDGVFSAHWQTPATITYQLRHRFPTLAPFPKVFEKSIHRHGDVDEASASSLRPREVPTLAALATSTDVSIPMQDLINRMTLYQNSTSLTERQLSEEDAEETASAITRLKEVISEFDEIKQLTNGIS